LTCTAKRADNAAMTNALLVFFAYLAGSLSSAVIVCRMLGLPDPRTQGSGNPGATNVLRLGGKKAAAMTLFGDAIKGVVPMLLGHWLEATPAVLALIGLAAFLGHLYPIFFGFQGGKGVATALGVQFGLDWRIGLLVALTWLVVAKLMRISSLAGLIAMTLAPLFVWLIWPEPLLLAMQLAMSALLVWRHRSNIRKLLAGTEGRISDER
jgi:glycerol-3-phosphate acyltransferase PlsY